MQYSLMDDLRPRFNPLQAALIAGTVDITLKTPFERVKSAHDREA